MNLLRHFALAASATGLLLAQSVVPAWAQTPFAVDRMNAAQGQTPNGAVLDLNSPQPMGGQGGQAFGGQFGPQPGSGYNPQLGGFGQVQPFGGIPQIGQDPFNNASNFGRGGQPPKRREPSALQRYLADTTGLNLRHFAEDLFDNNRFQAGNPQQTAPVPSTYTLGPGDEVMVRMWGGVSINYTGTIDRDGNFSIPRVGTFALAGVALGELNSYLSQQISKYYTNFNLSASLGQLKGIQVYVVGQAESPGLYTVSSLSTLVTSVFSVAKPGPNGSFRNIVLKRGGNELAKLDLYDFIRSGNIAGDRKLQSGDVIVIEKSGPRVAVIGAVEKPAIYELKPGEPLEVAVDLAGAQGSLTAKSEVLIERFDPNNPESPRQVLRKPYKQALADRGVQDGEVVKLFDITGDFGNAVTLRGNVLDNVRVPHTPDMKVSDLIPNESVLITRDYYRDRDRLVNVNQFNGNQSQGFGSNGMGNVNSLNKNQSADFGMGGGNNQRPQFDNQGNPIDPRSGISQKSGTDVDVVGNSVRNLLKEINWDYAVVERLDRKALRTVLLPFNLRKAIAKDAKENLSLQPGDIVTVFSIKDANVPKDSRGITVKVEGEVNAPGYYQVKPGETLHDVLVRAGGITRNAFVFGTKVTRESIKVQQRAQLQKVIVEAEKLLGSAARNNLVNADFVQDARAAQDQMERQRAMLLRMRDSEVEGRLVLDVPPDSKALFDLPPIALEDGDSITIPNTPSSVSVNGAVFSSGSYVYTPKASLGKYIELAGGATKLADKKSIFTVRANGQVLSVQQDSWLKYGNMASRQALPGDLIFVPEDYEYRLSFLKTFGQVSTIFYQLGLGVAAINSFRN